MKPLDTSYKITWVGLLVIQDRKILMVREKNKAFQLPGGGQELGETVEETLSREVSEELGITVSNLKLFDDFILPGRYEDVLIRYLVYTADISGEITIGKDIDELQWVDSHYEEKGIDIGNPTKLHLIAKLKSLDVID